MKKQITYLFVAAAMMVSTSVIAQNDRDRDRDRDDRGDFHLDEVYNMSSTGTLHLNSEDAEIRIIGSNRSDVHVKIDREEEIRGLRNRGRDFDMRIEEKGGDLYLTEREGSGVRIVMGSYRVDYEILIELPESASLRIRGEDDDYYVKNVNGAISIDTEDGDIELVDCDGDKFDFKLEDGDLKMDGGKGDFSLRLEDGDADIRNAKFGSLEADIEDGTISVETEIKDGGLYDIRSDDANVEFIVLNGGGDFTVMKDDGSIRASAEFDLKRETDYREEYTLPGGSAEVEIRTEDGRVRLGKK